MTQRLYELPEPPLAFEGEVISCESCPEGYSVALNQTAFFPEGGGQGSDLGYLDQAQVTAVQERDGVLWHIVDRALPIGQRVQGAVDVARRLDLAQQHSGEHVLSGCVHQNYGYNNVGFHIGPELVTLDFDGTLENAQWLALEQQANQRVWENLPVEILFPSPEALSILEYRSKRPLEGRVRIVDIPGVDRCACCGTHVARTGEIGLIHILDIQRHRKGTRLTIVCGSRALSTVQRAHEALTKVGASLSAPLLEVPEAAAQLLAQRDDLRRALFHWQELGLAEEARALSPEEACWFMEPCFSDGQARNMLHVRKACGLMMEDRPWAAVFMPHETGWQFVLSAKAMDLRPISKALCQEFTGRGGGKPDFIQGNLCNGSPMALKAWLDQAMKSILAG